MIMRAERVLILRLTWDLILCCGLLLRPHSPEQNGMVERVIRTLKEQCVHRHRFETLQHASRVIGDWINFYNNSRPHQSLGMKTPAEAFKLAA